MTYLVANVSPKWFAFVAAIAVWWSLNGVPKSRPEVFVIVLTAVFLLSRDAASAVRSTVFDWLPLFGVLFAYDLMRGYADELSRRAVVLPQLRFDEWLFSGTVPTVWLQDRLWQPGDPHWYDYAAWATYTSHFFVSFAVAIVLWKVAYRRFRAFATLFIGLTASALATYWLVPAAPPWMASKLGELPPTTRVVHAMWRHAGADRAASVFSPQPDAHTVANTVAALPSLHAAYPVLLALFFWKSARRRWLRAVLVAYPIAMGLTLIYGAEHYVADIVLGWAYAALVWSAYMLGASWVADRRASAYSTEATTASAAQPLAPAARPERSKEPVH